MTSDLARYGIEVGCYYGTVKVTFMEADSCVVQKWRDVQETFTLCSREHFKFAKELLGTSVGLGVRCTLKCSLSLLFTNIFCQCCFCFTIIIWQQFPATYCSSYMSFSSVLHQIWNYLGVVIN
jgi:hypothetical protein